MSSGLQIEQAALSINELVDQITELAGHLNAASYRWLSLIAEFDRRQGWSDFATQSCANWLNWKCGLDMGAAREWVRVAHAIEKLPKVSAAMQRGALSYSKVRAITRVACEGTEDYFLQIALHGTAHHVETLVRHYRRAQEAEELSREAQQQANRFLSYRYDDDGSLVFNGRLPAEAGALLLKALDTAMQEIPFEEPADVSAATPSVKSTPRARRADALGMIAESFIKHGMEEMNGGDRHQIVVHIAAETLRDKTAGCCEIEEGPSIAAETARRFACDASVVALVENDQGEPLNAGRKTRTISPALRRALNARDRGCRFIGCTNTRYVEAHHVQHWADGGETKPSNLINLCKFHHRQVHEGNVLVQVLDDGAFRFVKPDGTSFDSVAAGQTQPPGDWLRLPMQHDQHGIHIDENTAIGVVRAWTTGSEFRCCSDRRTGVEVLTGSPTNPCMRRAKTHARDGRR
jgi:Domain of unknown function (DUF222)/HNH endonuclease